MQRSPSPNLSALIRETIVRAPDVQYDEPARQLLEHHLAQEGDFLSKVKMLVEADHGCEEMAVSLALSLQKQRCPTLRAHGWRGMEELAESGTNEARRGLAIALLALSGVPQKDSRAYELLRLVAEAETGDSHLKGLALLGLGRAQLHAAETRQEETKALQLLERAVGLGMAEAAYEIARYHQVVWWNGRVAAMDLPPAAQFFAKAAELGHGLKENDQTLMRWMGVAVPARKD